MEPQVAHPSNPHGGVPQARMDPKARFYRHFQEQVTSLQEQISQLGSIALVGGERQDATENIQAGISYLTKEVADASEYVPAYDQRTYARAIKELTELLNEELARLAPKTRFQFKQQQHHHLDDQTSATSDRQEARQNVDDARVLKGGPSLSDSAVHEDEDDGGAEEERTDAVGALPGRFTKNYNEELARPGAGNVRKPSFSSARDIGISDHTGLHIILPLTAAKATSSGSLTNLKACIVDMSAPAAGEASFASLTIKGVTGSLVVAGSVKGPCHVTAVKDSVIVVNARQVRMHECERVRVYLWCGSRPIIEDCKGMKFAPIPKCYLAQDAEDSPEKNQWDQVDDFKWLKADHSPNWEVMPEVERVPEEVWTKKVPGGHGMGPEDILREIGVL